MSSRRVRLLGLRSNEEEVRGLPAPTTNFPVDFNPDCCVEEARPLFRCTRGFFEGLALCTAPFGLGLDLSLAPITEITDRCWSVSDTLDSVKTLTSKAIQKGMNWMNVGIGVVIANTFETKSQSIKLSGNVPRRFAINGQLE